MSMLAIDLRNFLKGVPFCSPTATLEEVLERFCRLSGDRLVIINADRYPLGSIGLSRLLPYLLKRDRASPALRAVPMGDGKISQNPPLSDTIEGFCSKLESPILEPLVILPVDLTLERLLSHLQENSHHLSYALVDANSQFLGLLDSLRLLQWLAQPVTAAPDPSGIDLAGAIAGQQQRARELAAQNANLLQSKRLKDELLACISHQFKNSLTSISGLSKLLNDPRFGQLSDRQAQYAQLIHESSVKLMKALNQISDLSRIESAQLELRLEPVLLHACCEGAYQQAMEQVEKLPETSLAIQIEPGLETLFADEFRLSQILVNLLSNALKFTPPSGKIGVQVSRWGHWAALTVWDSGVGIPASLQPLIFQQFQPLENPLTHQLEGTGLGLVLAQRLARLHGGEITFTSKEGQGSQFTLLLPRQGLGKGSQQGDGEKQSSFDWSLDSLVLIVESDAGEIEKLSAQLNGFGYRVAIARSGTEALEKARQLKPCMIFLNPVLPLLSGWDLLTLLRADETTRHLRTIVMASEADKQQAEQSQADGFLIRPVQELTLRQVISTQPSPKATQNLTVLWLTQGQRDGEETLSEREKTSDRLTPADLNRLFHQYNCRVLEVDDLEQADLLARIWKPDVVVLDSTLPSYNPNAYLEEFSQYPDLAALPLVTLDSETTQAANQVANLLRGQQEEATLQVFPCLASPDACQADSVEGGTCTLPALLQVIQVAAGTIDED